MFSMTFKSQQKPLVKTSRSHFFLFQLETRKKQQSQTLQT